MKVAVEHRPAFTPARVAECLREQYDLDGRLAPLPAEWDQNFRLDCRTGDRFVVKLANRGIDEPLLEFQNAAMERLATSWSSGCAPRPRRSRDGRAIVPVIGDDGTTFLMRVLTYLEGEPLSGIGDRSGPLLDLVGFSLGELDRALVDFHHPAMDRKLMWDLRTAEWISSRTGSIRDSPRRGIVERLLVQHRGRVVPLHGELPSSVIHNDANDENLLLRRDAGMWVVSGLLDFGDMLRTHTVNELAIASAYAILDAADPLEAAAALAAGYHRARPLEEVEFEALYPLICLRLGLSVTISAIAAEEDPANAHRQITDARGWALLERLQEIDWRVAESRFRQACGMPRRSRTGAGAAGCETENAAAAELTLLKRRSAAIAPSLSLSYREPIAITHGRRQFLYDQRGHAWLDCVNNVCHVGHCHPKVVAALANQAAVLNTNTRYLHPTIIEYAERLTATLPEPLRVCYFVNSGSEANDLAVRIARTVTGRRDVMVIDGAYHGNTSTLVDLSPYKCEGTGGRGLPRWAHKVPAPDPYRGGPRGSGEDAGRAMAEPVRETCERLVREGHPPALFMCEPILGCGGQVIPPDGYLREAFRHVRAAGAFCLADEVQVGFGRTGTHMWAFEAQGVVPDIVTMGKPIGNGHPIGAVVTSAEIARAFDTGMEFFSTFGGNPVSAAVGLAVLEVIEEEQLQQRAARVGAYLLDGFRRLAEDSPAIGDVRGRGLFLGVELVRDRTTRTPATRETAELIERVKADGILLSSDGPHHNVLKIKPPLVFDEVDADLLIGSVRRALEAIF